RYNPDKVLAHLTSDMGNYLMAIFKFDSELCSGQCFDDRPRELDNFLVLDHKYQFVIIAEPTTVCKVFLDFWFPVEGLARFRRRRGRSDRLGFLVVSSSSSPKKVGSLYWS